LYAPRRVRRETCTRLKEWLAGVVLMMTGTSRSIRPLRNPELSGRELRMPNRAE